jgi:isopenicillin-N N-acyltransferase-like protein
MSSRRFSLIELSGSSHEIGYAYGTGCRDQIERAMVTFELKLREIGVDVDTAIDHAVRSVPYCREVALDLVQEVEGIAGGCGLSFEQVFSLNLYGASQRFGTAFPPECWALGASGAATADGRTFVLWTAEDDERWLDSCVLMRILPEGGMPCLMWTIAGCVGRPGLNPLLALSAVCRTTTDVGDGLPYPFVCRKILAAGSVAGAVEAISSVRRMSGMGYVVGDAGGSVAVVEASAG